MGHTDDAVAVAVRVFSIVEFSCRASGCSGGSFFVGCLLFWRERDMVVVVVAFVDVVNLFIVGGGCCC